MANIRAEKMEEELGGKRGINVRDTVTSAATRVLLLSAAFRCALSDGDEQIAAIASAEAVGLLNHLSLTIRKEQDANRDQAVVRSEEVGRIVENASMAEVGVMLANRRLSGPQEGATLNFRMCLNKIAHFDPENSTFNIIGTSHLLYLSGSMQGKNGKFFVAKIDIRALVEACLRSL